MAGYLYTRGKGTKEGHFSHFRICLFLWGHFDTTSSFLLIIDPSAAMMINSFSVAQRSHILPPHFYGIADEAMLNDSVYCLPVSFSFQITLVPCRCCPPWGTLLQLFGESLPFHSVVCCIDEIFFSPEMAVGRERSFYEGGFIRS